MSLRKGSATMRMSIGIPGFSIYFEHHQVKPFIKDQSKKAKDLFDECVVPAVLRGTCKALEVVANNTADAHDYLISKTKPKKSA
jgi:uncharacterized short protein YbdD (DUF466 family)